MNPAMRTSLFLFFCALSSEGAKTVGHSDKFIAPVSQNRTCTKGFGVSVAVNTNIFVIGYPYGVSCPRDTDRKGSILVYPMKNSTIQRPGTEIVIPGSAGANKRYFGNLVAANERFIVVAAPSDIVGAHLVLYIYSAQHPYLNVSTVKTEIHIDATAARDGRNTLYIDSKDDSIIFLPWSIMTPGFVYKVSINGSRKEWILAQKLKLPAIDPSAYLAVRQTVNFEFIIMTVKAVRHYEVKAFVFRKAKNRNYEFLQLLDDFDQGQGNPYETYLYLSDNTLMVFLPGVGIYKYTYIDTNETFSRTQTINKESLLKKGYFGAVTIDDKRLLYAGAQRHKYVTSVYNIKDISNVEAVLKLENSGQVVQKLIIRDNMVYMTTYMQDHNVYVYNLNTSLPVPSSAVSSKNLAWQFGLLLWVGAALFVGIYF